MTSGVHGSCHELVGWRLPRFTLQVEALLVSQPRKPHHGWKLDSMGPRLGKRVSFSSSEFSLPCEDPYLSCLEGRVLNLFPTITTSKSEKRLVGMMVAKCVNFWNIRSWFAVFFNTQIRKEINEKCWEYWKMPNCFSKSCGMWLASWWSTNFIPSTSLLSLFRFQSEILPFFLKQTEHLPPVWWWIASCPVNDPSIWPTNKANLYPYWQTQMKKKASYFKKVTWCRKFWCFFCVFVNVEVEMWCQLLKSI